jgi:hypothetical protein
VERTLSPIGLEAGAFESQLAGARGSYAALGYLIRGG